MASKGDPPLTLSVLVVLDQDVGPLVLRWPALTEEDGMAVMFVLAVMKRQDGVLLAVSHGVMSDDLQAGRMPLQIHTPLSLPFWIGFEVSSLKRIWLSTRPTMPARRSLL